MRTSALFGFVLALLASMGVAAIADPGAEPARFDGNPSLNVPVVTEAVKAGPSLSRPTCDVDFMSSDDNVWGVTSNYRRTGNEDRLTLEIRIITPKSEGCPSNTNSLAKMTAELVSAKDANRKLRLTAQFVNDDPTYPELTLEFEGDRRITFFELWFISGNRTTPVEFADCNCQTKKRDRYAGEVTNVCSREYPTDRKQIKIFCERERAQIFRLR